MPNIRRGMMAAAGAAGGAEYALWGWGQGEVGFLGNGTTTSVNESPIQIGSETYWLGRDPEDVRSIKLSIASSAGAITTDGGAIWHGMVSSADSKSP